MWSSDRRAGFTLIEAVAVMLIIALMASLAITMMPGTGRARLKAVTLEAAALLRRERMGAILTGRERDVAIDGERRILIGDSGSAVALPAHVIIDLFGTSIPSMSRATVVRFHPDGASSGAVLRLSREKAGYEIRINWYTGAISVEAR
jgi:general secretion pathway protein H